MGSVQTRICKGSSGDDFISLLFGSHRICSSGEGGGGSGAQRSKSLRQDTTCMRYRCSIHAGREREGRSPHCFRTAVRCCGTGVIGAMREPLCLFLVLLFTASGEGLTRLFYKANVLVYDTDKTGCQVRESYSHHLLVQFEHLRLINHRASRL